MVLILVVVDNGLVLLNKTLYDVCQLCLNPCCSGQWSRTVILFDDDLSPEMS